MKQISIEQHQMLEDLTGLQHTRTGRVRAKQNRSPDQTHKSGLVSQYKRRLDRMPVLKPGEPGYSKIRELLRAAVV
jgi:hypothetical protein